MITAESKLFDLSLLEQMEDQDFLVQVLKIYLEETPKDLLEMQDSLVQLQPEMVAKKAHKLKSSTGMLQADKLLGIFSQIEDIGKSGVMSTVLQELVKQAQLEYEILKSALLAHLQSV